MSPFLFLFILRRQSSLDDAASNRVLLYGSPAATGKGHRTDAALEKTFGSRKPGLEWYPEIIQARHSGRTQPPHRSIAYRNVLKTFRGEKGFT